MSIRHDPEHEAWLAEQARRQLAFGAGFAHPEGGAAWLDANGRPDLTRPVHTWITARMAHVYSLGALLDVPGAGELADVALAGLAGRLHDDEYGGWVSSIAADRAVDGTKSAYTHAFVLLAASTATLAGRPAAPELLDEAAAIVDRFRTDSGLYAERWDRAWTRLDDYRGVNANMHLVEAFLAAADATGEHTFTERALTIAERVVAWAGEADWRVPEHFDLHWQPLPDHHRDQPDHPFEPYGATVGHGLEWSRLLLTLRTALGPSAPDWMLPAARSLFERAVTDGWDADGQPGFVYTTDWEGRPVVRDRMHWVLAEAICAAAALHQATGEPSYDDLYRDWWVHAVVHHVDPENGSWRHQLTAELEPADSVWPGRPDLYHSLHAVLLPRMPLYPSAAGVLRDGSS